MRRYTDATKFGWFYERYVVADVENGKWTLFLFGIPIIRTTFDFSRTLQHRQGA